MKKDKFPKKIHVLGRMWKIKQIENLRQGELRLLGMCDYDGKVIYLEKNQPDDSKFSTLVHEAVHAWLELCGFNQTMNASEIEVHCQLVSAFVEDIVKSFK